MSEEMLEAVKVEGLCLPDALRDYYLVAGCETRLNRSFNRLLAPEDVLVEAGRIVFMEENQNVVYWGVPGDGAKPDPVVEQGVNLENAPLEWHSEHAQCAEFLEVTLYWQACMGEAMKYVAGTPATLGTQARLERDFRRVGTVGELHAYARQDCALCFVKWQEDGFEYRLFGGFRTRKLQNAVGRELGVKWEEY